MLLGNGRSGVTLTPPKKILLGTSHLLLESTTIICNGSPVVVKRKTFSSLEMQATRQSPGRKVASETCLSGESKVAADEEDVAVRRTVLSGRRSRRERAVAFPTNVASVNFSDGLL